jgi:exodeoxyribonuclease VII small subunit
MVAKPTFEKALTDLEKILQELESGDLPLEKAIKKFEQGMALSKFCEKTLDETERRISLIIKGENDEIALASFEDPESEDNE